MNRVIHFIALLLSFQFAVAQTPVPMIAQPGLTYTENFSDIANWASNFAAGIGANRFGAVATGGILSIPDATRITVSNVFQTTITSGGVQKGTDQTSPSNSIVLLTTGTTNNSSSTAFDLFLDFTGVNAGTISFDYQTISNSLVSGANDRAGSLRVYTSIDGVAFNEITNVLNFINHTPVNGSISTINLPTSFNNSPTARVRFYYHNGFGGSAGSRPKISIDNLSITAVPNVACVTPTAQPTGLNFGTITSSSIAGSFTAASPAPNDYMVVISNSSSLTSLPADGTIYNVGDNVGDGYVVSNGSSTSFNATALSASTNYYFFIFSVNSICTGGIKYLTTAPLIGNTVTIAALPPCIAPTAQPTALTFGTVTPSTIQGSFTAASADGYLILRSLSATLVAANPVNGFLYNVGDALGNAVVVQQSNLTTFTATGLATNTLYYFFVFSYNNLNCSNGPAYFTTAPLNNSRSTADLSPCTTPTTQPNNLTLTVSNNIISGNFRTGTGADSYLVISSTTPTPTPTPSDNTTYSLGNSIGAGTVISINANRSFVNTGLTANSSYYYFVYAYNKNCSGGSKYLLASPLTGNATTTNDPINNYYFGNLHAHSEYSDGNKDNLGPTPYDNYQFAMVSQCMDFLGISDHNHYGAGTRLSNFQLGVTQANTFNTNYPGFVALYGMEWGVISNGGHVLIYGDGMNNLWGWESGSGSWGTGNNYNVFVDKPDYLGANGLFSTVNNNVATNTFASLAHPNSSDYTNLSNISYNAMADAAITLTAVESGPSTSTNTTYSNPGSSMNYLWYYQKMLGRGYHLAPSIDHDNHNTTFGRTTYSRSAVVAPFKTKTEIIKAFRNRNAYATQDCDIKVDFTLNTKIMGNIITGNGAPVISVLLTDATTNLSSAIIRVMYGVPGSGINAVKIDSAIGSSLIFVDNNLANAGTGYYYIDITNGTGRVVTAPVWYTRLDNVVLPVTFSAFTLQKVDKVAKLSWTTAQESNSSHFIIERSTDGRNWQSVATIAAAGYSTSSRNYVAFDNLPLDGTNYYRIKQVDRDSRFEVSTVKSIFFKVDFNVSIAPNPATDFVELSLRNAYSKGVNIQLFNASGKMIYSTTSIQNKIRINTSHLTRGLYFVKLIQDENTVTQKILLQ